MVLSYDANPTVSLKILPDSGERQTSYEFSNISAAYDDHKTAAAKHFLSRITEKLSADNHPEGKYVLQVDGFTYKTDKQSSKEYTLAADIDYKGQQPSLSLASSGQTEMTLNTFSLTSSDFSATADGKIASTADDPLPSGTVNLKLTNIPNIIANEFVPDFARQSLSEAFEKATGQPADELKNATVALTREKGGVFYVGNATFDELAAGMLASMFGMQPPPSDPMAPAAGESDSEQNIMPEIPENSN